MGRPKKVSSDVQFDDGEVSMKQMKTVVRVITRTPGLADNKSIFEARFVDDYISELLSDGWNLEHTAFTGMEQFLDKADAGFRMLYVLTK